MLVVVVYDISTISVGGNRRLRKIHAICSAVGIPVQHSVYECELNAEQYRNLKKQIEVLICKEVDSVRFYLLGRNYDKRIETLGRDEIQWDRECYVI